MPLIEIDPATQSPAPVPAAQQPVFTAPPVGTSVNVVSAINHRGLDADGKVVGTDGNGIAIRLPDANVARFYPWQQVAYVQWEPPAEVMEQAAVLGGDFAVTEADQAAIIAVLSKIPGIEYPSEAADKVRAWDGYIIEGDPQGTFTSEEFVRELAKAGIPVKHYVARPAEKRPIIVGETAWGGGETGFGVTGMDDGLDFGAGALDSADYNEAGEPPPGQIGEMVLRPAQHAYRLPPSLASCYPDHEIAIWAAASHGPEELEAIHKVTEARDFGEYLRRIRDHVLGPMPGTPAREAWEKAFGGASPIAPGASDLAPEFPTAPEPHAPGTCGVFAPGHIIPEMANVRCSLPIHTGDHQATVGQIGAFHWRETGDMAGFPHDGPSDNWRPQPAPPCGLRLPMGSTIAHPDMFATTCRLPRHNDGAHEVVNDEGRLFHWFDDGHNPVSGKLFPGPAPDAPPLAWVAPCGAAPLPVYGVNVSCRLPAANYGHAGREDHEGITGDGIIVHWIGAEPPGVGRAVAPVVPEPAPAPSSEDPQELPPEPGEAFPDPGLQGGPADEDADVVAKELAHMEAAFRERVSGPLDAGAKAIADAEALLGKLPAPEPEGEKPTEAPEDKPWTLPGQE